MQRRSRDANSCSVEEEEQQWASITISEDHINDNNSVNSSCSIYDDNFQLGEEAYRIQFCSDVYHRPCLLKWLLQPKKTVHSAEYKIPTASIDHELI